jgi:predicted lipoprotein with Yx(FWY)xxD motif
MRLSLRSSHGSRALLAAPLVALTLALAACGGDNDDAQPAEQAAPVAESNSSGNEQKSGGQSGKNGGNGENAGNADKADGTTITTGDSQFGEILFDGDDRAIYIFDKEKTSESECYGDCAVAWPPVLTDGKPRSNGGAQNQLLGTTERRDGSTQVTYDGQPLYYYVDDPPGVVLCHNVAEFGGLWLVLQADGAAVS